MKLLNNIFDLDQIEINKINKICLRALIIIVWILFVGVVFIKKDYYYENVLIKENDNIIFLVDKDEMNNIQNKEGVLINKIQSKYSINKIISCEDICYVDINITTNMENITGNKYKILLGKERIIEYLIRIIKKRT